MCLDLGLLSLSGDEFINTVLLRLTLKGQMYNPFFYLYQISFTIYTHLGLEI